MVPVIDANNEMFKRYLAILKRIDPNTRPDDPTGIQHLIWMCETAIERPDMYVDKHSRWLGYVQGVLAMRRHIDVEEERAFSRRLYHYAYLDSGLYIPPTLGPDDD